MVTGSTTSSDIGKAHCCSRSCLITTLLTRCLNRKQQRHESIIEFRLECQLVCWFQPLRRYIALRKRKGKRRVGKDAHELRSPSSLASRSLMLVSPSWSRLLRRDLSKIKCPPVAERSSIRAATYFKCPLPTSHPSSSKARSWTSTSPSTRTTASADEIAPLSPASTATPQNASVTENAHASAAYNSASRASAYTR